MKTILNFIFQRLPIVRELDGYKTLLAAIFIALSALSTALVDIVPLFPGYEFLGQAQASVAQALELMSKLFGYLGEGFAYGGLLGKWAKK